MLSYPDFLYVNLSVFWCFIFIFFTGMLMNSCHCLSWKMNLKIMKMKQDTVKCMILFMILHSWLVEQSAQSSLLIPNFPTKNFEKKFDMCLFFDLFCLKILRQRSRFKFQNFYATQKSCGLSTLIYQWSEKRL